jgi:uncharacterized membrane protein
LPEETSAPAPAPTPSPAPAAKSGGDDNLMGAISYIGIIAVVMLLVKKDSEYVQFHAKQGTVLFIGEVILGIVGTFIWVLFFVWGLVWLVFLLASIIGFIKALSGEKYKLPVVGDLADKINI